METAAGSCPRVKHGGTVRWFAYPFLGMFERYGPAIELSFRLYPRRAAALVADSTIECRHDGRHPRSATTET